MPHAWRQRQVADASHLVVLAVRNGYAETDVDANLFRMAEVRGGTPDALMGFKNMVMKTLVHGMSQEDLAQWAKCQAYIALGQFMAVAALLGIDTCPMEGFVPAKMDEALGLATRGYTTAVLCPAGYRSEDDRYATCPRCGSSQKTSSSMSEIHGVLTLNCPWIPMAIHKYQETGWHSA